MKKTAFIETPLSSIEKIANLAAILALIAHFALIAYHYDSLPERIPTHFGVDGKADDWGDKNTLWILLALTLALFGFLRIISRMPYEHMNHAVKITAKNAQKQYQITRELLSLLSAGINLLFLSIGWGIIQVVQGGIEGLGLWFVLATLLFVFGPIGYAFVQAHKYK